MLHFAPVLDACGYNINTGGVDAGMSQNICQLGNILFNAVKGAGKQMTQIVGEHLAGGDPSQHT